MRLAVVGANQRAVVADHRERSIKLSRDGHGEIVAAPGHESDLDAAARGLGDGRAIGFGQVPAAVEQRAVDVQRDEAYRHGPIIEGNGAGFGPVERPVYRASTATCPPRAAKTA